MTAADAAQLYAEPYAFLAPVIRRAWFVPPTTVAIYARRRPGVSRTGSRQPWS